MTTLTLLAAALWLDAPRSLGLMRRGRYFMLAIFLVFAWGTPGRLLWPELTWASPSFEGLLLALTHVLRLLCVLLLVALLLARLPVSTLVTALCGVMWPWRRVGLDASRAALRLALVLRYCMAGPDTTRWRDWLAMPVTPHEPPVRLALRPFAMIDWLTLVALLALVGVLW